MSEYGTLNQHPIGPVLPDPIPCERCGHPIWLGQDLVVLKKKQGSSNEDQLAELRCSVWEMSLQPIPGSTWTLDPHTCRKEPQ